MGKHANGLLIRHEGAALSALVLGLALLTLSFIG